VQKLHWRCRLQNVTTATNFERNEKRGRTPALPILFGGSSRASAPLGGPEAVPAVLLPHQRSRSYGRDRIYSNLGDTTEQTRYDDADRGEDVQTLSSPLNLSTRAAPTCQACGVGGGGGGWGWKKLSPRGGIFQNRPGVEAGLASKYGLAAGDTGRHHKA